MDRILIDTDVILDFFFDREPYSGHAADILSLCELKEVKGYVTPVICSNVYYILNRTSKHDKVLAKLNQLMSFLDVLPMNRDVVMKALSSDFRDFEDALQDYAAVRSGTIDVILTRNVRDYSRSEIGVLSPETYLKTISTGRNKNND